MHDISHSVCKLQIVWNVDVCVVPLHVHFRWGVALVEEFNYWALLTPSCDPPFRYREYSGRRRPLEAASEKKADMWLWLYVFVKHV